MKNDYSSEKDALKAAMQNEIDSRKLYLDAEKTAKTEISKKTFAYLAAQEFLHLEKLKRVEVVLAKSVDIDIEQEMISNLDDTKQLFKHNIKEWGQKLADAKDFEAYEIAMEVETKGYNFYEEAAKETENRKIKRFFLYLRDEEASHFELLQNMENFLKNPGQWNADNEKWFFEG